MSNLERMTPTHEMVKVADNGEEIAFECPTCDRHIVFKRSGDLIVLNPGDFYARHHGGNLTVTTS